MTLLQIAAILIIFSFTLNLLSILVILRWWKKEGRRAFRKLTWKLETAFENIEDTAAAVESIDLHRAEMHQRIEWLARDYAKTGKFVTGPCFYTRGTHPYFWIAWAEEDGSTTRQPVANAEVGQEEVERLQSMGYIKRSHLQAPFQKMSIH